MELMSERWGTNLSTRAYKLTEEVEELWDAVSEYTIGAGSLEDIIDELADVNVVVAHINHILGKSHEELLGIAEDKIIKRFDNPNYKRKHPHNEH